MSKQKNHPVKIPSHEIFEIETIESLNEILRQGGYEIRKDESQGDYQSHFIYHADSMIFETIYPKELLIKVAQLLPESEVRLGRYEVFVGDTDLSQETLMLVLPAEFQAR